MVIASIDLNKGKAVQLVQGKEKKIEKNNPVELAEKFSKFGEIALIDLDSAMNKENNLELIKKIIQFSDCRVGGGIRDIKKAKKLVSLGASKIIVGTEVFKGNKINFDFLEKLQNSIGKHRIIVAIDSIGTNIVINGWQKKTKFNLFKVIKEIEPFVSEFLFTNVEREGKMEGVDLNIIKKLKKTTSKKLTVAGGVTSLEEIETLAKLKVDVQLGMALYTNKIDLTSCFIASLDWGKTKELIPTITQNQNGQVLMLAYSSKDSLKNSFDSGYMWYYSRTRKKLWKKGETSGNTQKIIKLRTDCDRDAILATVEQNGPACHLDTYSCFGDREFSLEYLQNIISDRIKNPRKSSYTSSLDNKKVREKILEEAKELIEANSRDNIIWETADLLYFITVLLEKSEVNYKQVFNELRRRRKQ